MTLAEVQIECERHLQALEPLFKPHCRLTLLMRNPESDDGDLIFTQDELAAVENAVRRLRERES